MKHYPAPYKLVVVILLSFLSFFFFARDAYACDTQNFLTRKLVKDSCGLAICNGQQVSGTWQGYVTYTYNPSVVKEGTCTQLEYFPNSSCEPDGPRAQNPCPATCQDSSECGEGECAPGNCTGTNWCTGSCPNTTPKWCQGFSCGYICNTSNWTCRNLNYGEGVGTTLSICQSACVQTPLCNTRVQCDSSTCNAPTAQCGFTSGTQTCEYTSHRTNGSNCIRTAAPSQSCSLTWGDCPAGQTCVDNQCVVSQGQASCSIPSATSQGNSVTVEVTGQNLDETSRDRYSFNFFSGTGGSGTKLSEKATTIPPETQKNTFTVTGGPKSVSVFSYDGTTPVTAENLSCGVKDITQQLSCDFTYNCKDLKCDFASTYTVGSVKQTSYDIKYDFGDGKNTGNWKAASTVTKLYDKGDTYRVTLEAQKNDGSGYCKLQKDVKVTESPQLENCRCGDVCGARCCDPGENSNCPSIVSKGSRCRDGLTCSNGVCGGPICGIPGGPPPPEPPAPPKDCQLGCIDDQGRPISCLSDQATTNCSLTWLGNTSPFSVGETRTVDRFIDPGVSVGDFCNDRICRPGLICTTHCNKGIDPDPDLEGQQCWRTCDPPLGGSTNPANYPPPEQIADIQVLLGGDDSKGTFKDIHYRSSNINVCKDPPDPPDGFYNSNIEAVGPGTVNIIADVYMQIEGSGHYLTCSCGLPLTVKALPSCLVDLVPSTATLSVGESKTLVASIISKQDGTVSEVHFAPADSSIATVSPQSDNTVSYSTNVTGVKAASSTKVTATVHMDPGHVVGCSDQSDVKVTQSGPWWQTKDGDVASNASISSYIPKQCVDSAQCTEEFSLVGDGGYPGVVIYGISSSFGQGKVSGKGWLANSVYTGRRYDYDWFSRLAPPETFTTAEGIIEDTQIPGGELVSGFQAGGYIWRYRAGDLSINGTANLGDRKVILFVSGNLKINDRITLNKGKGFFMAIAKGDINIDASVSHPNQPAVEGLYLADGTISTGSKVSDPDKDLYVRGALVGLTNVNLQRDLDPKRTTGDNALTPAEFIEYAPDLIFTFPRELARSGLVWREVAP